MSRPQRPQQGSMTSSSSNENIGWNSSKVAFSQVFHKKKLDCKQGYWSLELDEESSLLTIFNSPLWRIRYKKNSFGLITSQDDFQRFMDEFLEKLNSCADIVDDN